MADFLAGMVGNDESFIFGVPRETMARESPKDRLLRKAVTDGEAAKPIDLLSVHAETVSALAAADYFQELLDLSLATSEDLRNKLEVMTHIKNVQEKRANSLFKRLKGLSEEEPLKQAVVTRMKSRIASLEEITNALAEENELLMEALDTISALIASPPKCSPPAKKDRVPLIKRIKEISDAFGSSFIPLDQAPKPGWVEPEKDWPRLPIDKPKSEC